LAQLTALAGQARPLLWLVLRLPGGPKRGGHSTTEGPSTAYSKGGWNFLETPI